jgi:hypothetical protein
VENFTEDGRTEVFSLGTCVGGVENGGTHRGWKNIEGQVEMGHGGRWFGGHIEDEQIVEGDMIKVNWRRDMGEG